MLDRNAMAQLKGLREELEAQNEHVEATVKGTQHRYGFAVTDDGREIFIPPDEMLKVLPGDKVAICIRPAKPVMVAGATGDISIAGKNLIIKKQLSNLGALHRKTMIICIRYRCRQQVGTGCAGSR